MTNPLTNSILGPILGAIGRKFLDIIVPVIFIVFLFFMAKALVVKAFGWGEEEQLKAQIKNKDVVIQTIQTVNEATVEAVQDFSAGHEIKQEQAVATIERMDASSARDVLRAVELATAHGRAEATALHEGTVDETQPDNPVRVAKAFAEPLSPDDLAFIRAANNVMQSAYEDAVKLSN